MPVPLPSSEKDSNRKLKTHRKSRGGCRNCKLRRVKCDESKPTCEKCTAYGVFCNYDCKYSDLQLFVDGASNINVLQIPIYLPNQIIPNSTIAPSLRNESMESSATSQLEDQDVELLSTFQARTVLTITTDQTLHIHENEIIKLACSHSFLMHAVLTLILMHDRHLSAEPNKKLSTTEAFHWYQSIALFNTKLSGPIQPSERDALWATAALLGTIAFYYVEAKTPEDVWPLKPPSSLDLNWLRMSDGNMEIWKITQPSRADSVFRPLVLGNGNFALTNSTGPGLEALPPEFTKLYGIEETSTKDNNPYHTAVFALAPSLNGARNHSTILNFMSFVNGLRPEYKRLLEEKDPRALLLLAYWYAKIYQYQHWWVWRRAALECQAICIYLERYHPHETEIQKLMKFPRSTCGIVPN